MKQKQQNQFIIKNARKASYLIGDSTAEGKDQILCDTLKYNNLGLYDAQNESRIESARRRASEGDFCNIRIVTVFYDAVCIKLGVIGYKERKRTCKPFNLAGHKHSSWTY